MKKYIKKTNKTIGDILLYTSVMLLCVYSWTTLITLPIEYFIGRETAIIVSIYNSVIITIIVISIFVFIEIKERKVWYEEVK
jgi:hypothetical protein